MATRLFNGRTNSEDGWPYVDQGSCTWVTVPGTHVTLQIQNGQPLAIMQAVAADFDDNVEPLRDADSACWTSGNSVATSNHPGGTAMDLNWNSHAFQVVGTFNAAQQQVIKEIVDFYEGMIGWAGPGYWQGGPVDEMHWQMGYNTFNNLAKVNDFIARKIRADGFSTFRRGNAAVTPALTRAQGYAVQIINEGRRRGITARGIIIALSTGLVESNLQVYANERVPASMLLPHDNVGSDAYSVGIFQQQVRDTGNGWWWGDAATCMDPTKSAGLFYDRLARLNYNGPNSPGSYAQAVQDSAYPDRYDQRFAEATALYDQLSAYQNDKEDDDMAQVPQEQWDLVFGELSKKFPSRSPLRHLDQTQFYPGGLVDTFAGMTLNDDGMEHVQYVIALAGYNHPDAMALLNELAAADPAQFPDRAQDIKLAQAILNKVALDKVAKATAAVAVGAVPAAAAAPVIVNQSATVTPAQVQQIADAAANAVTATNVLAVRDNVSAGTTGQKLGAAYDSLEALKSDLTPAGKATVDALIGALQTEIGAQA